MTLDSYLSGLVGLRRNDGNGHFQTFCEAIKVDSKTYCEKIKRKRFPYDYTENTYENFLPPCGGGLRWGERLSFITLTRLLMTGEARAFSSFADPVEDYVVNVPPST